MKKRILITGGAGLIGQNLCRQLLKSGNHVTCLDNFSTGDKSAIAAFLNHPDFTLLEHDVTIPFELEADEIYNLACPASQIHYQRTPLQTLRTCVLGAMNTLELAKKNGAKILQTSTSEIYGDPETTPQPEDYLGAVNPVGPRACYAEGKRCAETFFYEYRENNGVDAKIIRIFNTYGPGQRQDDGRVVSNFITQALKNQPLTIYGDGSQTRSFCYVDDLVEGMRKMMGDDHAFAGPVNLGTDHEMEISQLAQLIIELTDSKSQLEYCPLPTDDPKRRRPDIRLANEKLGWQPKTSIREGLKHTIEYFIKLN